jgi:hypothetical protein
LRSDAKLCASKELGDGALKRPAILDAVVFSAASLKNCIELIQPFFVADYPRKCRIVYQSTPKAIPYIGVADQVIPGDERNALLFVSGHDPAKKSGENGLGE